MLLQVKKSSTCPASENNFKRQISLIFAALILTFTTFLIAEGAPGDLDSSFGSGGVVLTPVGTTNDRIYGIAIQADGKIIAVGYSENGTVESRSFALVRYNSNGTLDASFGNGGKVVTDTSGINNEDYGRAVKIQADGKFVVIGYASNGANYDFAIARYNTDGTLDSTFGNAGKVITPFGSGNDLAKSLIIQPDGKIITAGEADIPGSSRNYALVRYNSDGMLDNTFGTAGKVSTDFNTMYDAAESVLLQTDGKIVASGYSFVAAGASAIDFSIARYNSDGTLDTSFATGGKRTTDIAGSADFSLSATIQSDGKIISAGRGRVGTNDEFALVRYNPDGSLDTTFGTNGIVITVLSNTASDGAFAVALQTDGRIIAAGHNANTNFAVIRYNTNGSLDSSFGTGGAVLAPSGQARAAAIQPDYKIIAGGYVSSGANNDDFEIVRYIGAAASRRAFADFDGDGKADISVFRPSNGTWYLLCSQAGFSAAHFGIATDKLAPADYDSDGKTDAAVFRDGNWYISQSSNNGFHSVQFGLSGDIPVPADYDGDEKADVAVFRQGIWYILQSSNNQLRAIQFGTTSDIPVPADFDGDGKTDIAVFRSGTWYWLQSSDNQFKAMQFGIASDKPVVGDYDGDNKADQAVFRNGVWYLLRSTAGFTAIQFGVSTDIPTPADYDGDSKTDISVFRDGNWYRLNSTNNSFVAVQFGISTDKAVPAAFIP